MFYEILNTFIWLISSSLESYSNIEFVVQKKRKSVITNSSSASDFYSKKYRYFFLTNNFCLRYLISTPKMSDVFIVSAARTPIGEYIGFFS